MFQSAIYRDLYAKSFFRGGRMSKRFMLDKVGSCFILTELQRGWRPSLLPFQSFKTWESLERHLVPLGALPEVVQRAKAQFDCGETPVVVIEIASPAVSP